MLKSEGIVGWLSGRQTGVGHDLVAGRGLFLVLVLIWKVPPGGIIPTRIIPARIVPTAGRVILLGWLVKLLLLIIVVTPWGILSPLGYNHFR